MKKLYAVTLALSVFLVFGCSKIIAPTMTDGGKITILVLSDRGDPNTMTEKQFGWRNMIGDWMESDLIRILNNAGYDARLIGKRDEFTPQEGKYLLSVTIKMYNPGSQIARALVGFGVGATSLNTRYEFFGGEDEPLLTKDDGVGSSRGWNYSARELNVRTTRDITTKLMQLKSQN